MRSGSGFPAACAEEHPGVGAGAAGPARAKRGRGAGEHQHQHHHQHHPAAHREQPRFVCPSPGWEKKDAATGGAFGCVTPAPLPGLIPSHPRAAAIPNLRVDPGPWGGICRIPLGQPLQPGAGGFLSQLQRNRICLGSLLG